MSEKKYKIQDIRNIAPVDLLSQVRDIKDDGYRFVQLCGTKKEEGYEILYSFDKEHVLLNLRLIISDEDEVESITKEYWPAFIYENEVHDLFDITFKHNALDYGGNFFKTAEPYPWK